MILPALTAGLVTSLHCIGMCGPLACAVCPKNVQATQKDRTWMSLPAYHGGRLLSYTLIGLLLGALGQSISGVLPTEFPKFLPWAFIGLFFLMFLGLEKKWSLPEWKWIARLRSTLPLPTGGPAAAGFLGLGTPLLPCGPLYLVFGLALLSGSWIQGAAMMAAFALGTIPLLLLLQISMVRWQSKVSPRTLRNLQRGLALTALAVMVWRVLAGDPMAIGQESACPMCH